MKKYIIAAAFILAGSTTAFAGPDCSAMAHDTPLSSIVKAFEDADGTIKLAKVTSGNCYEIYGTQDGVQYEVYYNPQTGEELVRNTK